MAMDPIITKVTLKRFRSFPFDKMELNNPLFLVGQNGAGKSNYADLFSFAAESMSLPLQAVFDSRGGISAVRNRSASRSYPPNLGLRFEFGAVNGNVVSGVFAFEVKALPNYGFEVVREQCEVQFTDKSRYWFDRKKEFTTNAEGLKPSVEASALSLPVVGGDERFAPIFKALANMRVYSIEPAKLREMQEPGSGTVLKSDGSNAASVLQQILRTSEETKDEILGILSGIVPNTKSVIPKKLGNKLSLEFVQEWATGKKLHFEAFNMSDGTLRALGLIMAVYQKPSPSVLVIEEPEATIHPGALGAVLDLIRHASKFMQVVVTTHSPELLNADWIKHPHLRIVVWKEGASHVLSPDQATREAMQEHLMGAGELLRSNALNPEDLFREDIGQELFRDFSQ